MQNFVRLYLMLMIYIVISIIPLPAQPPFNKTIKDTIQLGEYKAVFSDLYNEDGEKVYEEMTIYKDGQIINSTGSNTVWLYNFGTDNDESSGEKYRKDINGDGIDEIISIGFTGLGDCCNIVSIFSLGDNFSELNRFNLKEVEVFFLEDLDNDLIPEFLFRDAAFVKWHAPFSQSPRPLLIWKWYKGKYRLANFKFSDYLLSQITDEDFRELEELIKKRIENEYDPEDEYFSLPPPRLWGVMLEYIYAGKSEKADSIFNQYWPKEIPDKEEFYESFQKRLKKGPFWKELQESYWIEFKRNEPIKDN